MSTQSLFVALPVYRDLDAFFVQSLLKLVNDPPVEKMCVRMNPGDSLVSRARNSLTATFLESDCTDLLFIDTDLIFSPEHVARILSHDVDVVGGSYPKKQEGPLSWVVNLARDCQGPRPDGLQRVQYIGTGFLRVRRRVFEKMVEAYGKEIMFRPDHATDRMEYDFWSVGCYQYPDGYRRHLSEDWFFCQRWLDLGGEVWGDTRVVLKHVGQAVYPLRSQEKELLSGSRCDSEGAGDGAIAPTAPVSRISVS